MGKNIKSSFVVTEFEPGRRIAIETVESTFPIQVDHCPSGSEVGR
jgi:hypothetical protein